MIGSRAPDDRPTASPRRGRKQPLRGQRPRLNGCSPRSRHPRVRPQPRGGGQAGRPAPPPVARPPPSGGSRCRSRAAPITAAFARLTLQIPWLGLGLLGVPADARDDAAWSLTTRRRSLVEIRRVGGAGRISFAKEAVQSRVRAARAGSDRGRRRAVGARRGAAPGTGGAAEEERRRRPADRGPECPGRPCLRHAPVRRRNRGWREDAGLQKLTGEVAATVEQRALAVTIETSGRGFQSSHAAGTLEGVVATSWGAPTPARAVLAPFRVAGIRSQSARRAWC